MKTENLETLQRLFKEYYLEKRDMSSCNAVFALRVALKAIELDLLFQITEQQKKDDNER